jgi:hypothetical protein
VLSGATALLYWYFGVHLRKGEKRNLNKSKEVIQMGALNKFLIVAACAALSIAGLFVYWAFVPAPGNRVPESITIQNGNNISGILQVNETVNTSGFEMCSYVLPAISNSRVCRQICQKDNLTGEIFMNESDSCLIWCLCKKD